MRKLTVFMHVSLDGFVAGLNGELDWVNIDNEMFEFVGKRINVTDTALYGRNTYQMMEAYWPTAGTQPNATAHDVKHSTWYNQAEKIVLSKTMQSDSKKKIKVINNNLAAEITKLKQVEGNEILIFGSPGAVHSLSADQLIDEYWLFLNPVLLGQGIPLFKESKEQSKLKLITTHVFLSGVVCLNYVKH
jgi:dihydrofolate reductase